MYRIKDAEYGAIIEETISPRWVKQQNNGHPILAQNLEEADGVIINPGLPNEVMLGIKKEREPGAPNMDNYTPLVTIKEVSSDPYVFARLEVMQSQIDAVHTYQTEETVLKSELNTAYTQGVNAI